MSGVEEGVVWKRGCCGGGGVEEGVGWRRGWCGGGGDVEGVMNVTCFVAGSPVKCTILWQKVLPFVYLEMKKC